MINPDPYHYIRVRNYEDDLEEARLTLESVLSPIGVKIVSGRATGIDTTLKSVTVSDCTVARHLSYDKLIVASGSHLIRPDTPGVADHTQDIDTYASAIRLQEHNQAGLQGAWH
nr:FAD-dependent oxidoreductase [Pseudomonas gingeri]